MKLREYLRKEFSMYIRSKLVKDECEWCGGTKDLHFHHIDRFHNLLNETLEELNLNELDTKNYKEYELMLISNTMLAKQIKAEYKTLCKKCHLKLHAIESKKDIYKNNYQNPFGDYFNVDINYLNKDNSIDNYMFRFLKLCSHMGYDGYIRFGNSKRSKNLIVKKDMIEILGISDRETDYTYNYLLENEMIVVDNKRNIKINPKIAFKGSSSLLNTTKIFSANMIRLYLNTNINCQGTIYYIFKLVGFTNIKYNILNSNEIERDLASLKSFSVKGICRVNNFNESNIQRIFRILRETQIDEDNYLLYKININSRNYYVINPCLVYRGALNSDIVDCYNLIGVNNEDC